MPALHLVRGSDYLVSSARVVQDMGDIDRAGLAHDESWDIVDSSPYISWIAGDFVEGDKANSNKQFWTAGDLELAEYTIRYAPLNMIHKWREPVGMFAATRTVSLDRNLPFSEAGLVAAGTDPDTGSMKIQALAGLWTHIFPMESKIVERASDEGLLYFSMECVGSHLRCAGPDGCGQEFAYDQPQTHCEHLASRTSIRHIVNPVFRGGALIVPPVKPGWKEARASVLSEAVMTEAAAYAEAAQRQTAAFQGPAGDMTASAWEHLMGMVIANADSDGRPYSIRD